MRLLMITMAMLGLAACSSVPISGNQAEAIPSDDIRAGAPTAATPELTSEITVVRDTGGTVFGMAAAFDIKVDGDIVATISRPGTKFSIFVKPGPHTVQVARRTTSKPQPFTAGTQVIAQDGKDTELHTGEDPSGNEPLRIFVGDVTPI